MDAAFDSLEDEEDVFDKFLLEQMHSDDDENNIKSKSATENTKEKQVEKIENTKSNQHEATGNKKNTNKSTDKSKESKENCEDEDNEKDSTTTEVAIQGPEKEEVIENVERDEEVIEFHWEGVDVSEDPLLLKFQSIMKKSEIENSVPKPEEVVEKNPLSQNEVLEQRLSLMISNMLNVYGRIISIPDTQELVAMQKKVIEETPGFGDLSESLQRKMILLDCTVENIGNGVQRAMKQNSTLRRNVKKMEGKVHRRDQEILKLKQIIQDSKSMPRNPPSQDSSEPSLGERISQSLWNWRAAQNNL